MKKIFLLVLIAAGVISCDKTEAPIYDGSSQTLVYFETNSANLDVVIDDQGSASIQINSSSLSDQDRSVNLEIVEDDTTVDFQNVDIPSLTVTIPAGEYFGQFVVNGIDNTVETAAELLTVRIASADGATVDPTPVEIRVRQICPIQEGLFTGPYLLQQVTPIHPANGVLTFPEVVVDVSVSGGSTERAFSAVWLAGLGIGQAASTIPMDFSCNNVLVTSDSIGTSLTCGDGPITLGSASTTGTYDPNDDSQFNVIISEYLLDGGCGVSPALVTEFNLIKQ